MAHSFVRGNWGNQEKSSPMILAKCCHDLDLIVWNMARPCTQISSIGSLLHFRPESVDKSIPARCTDGCPIERDCIFSAIKIYLEFAPFHELRAELGDQPIEQVVAPRIWPFNIISEDQTYAGRLNALKNGPYGRCVYHSDNNVVDHQVVSLDFEGGATVVLIMQGHSHQEHRSLRYDGTKATVLGSISHEGATYLEIHDHGSRTSEIVPLGVQAGGHGGGDAGIMASFLRSLRGEALPSTDARTSLESHLLAFAAEESRLNKTAINFADFRERAEKSVSVKQS
jgi:predicted dehydrogenase